MICHRAGDFTFTCIVPTNPVLPYEHNQLLKNQLFPFCLASQPVCSPSIRVVGGKQLIPGQVISRAELRETEADNSLSLEEIHKAASGTPLGIGNEVNYKH